MKLKLLAAFIFTLATGSLAARQQRCYDCRSRGPLGDCRDPFYTTANSTVPQAKQSPDIKALPCASGWCKKFVGNIDVLSDRGDQGGLVERGCLGGGPEDKKSRCFDLPAYKNGIPGTLCICRGDLCNNSSTHRAHLLMLASLVTLASCRTLY